MKIASLGLLSYLSTDVNYLLLYRFVQTFVLEKFALRRWKASVRLNFLRRPILFALLAIFFRSSTYLHAEVLLPQPLPQEDSINRLEVVKEDGEDRDLWIFGSRGLYRLAATEKTVKPVKEGVRPTAVALFNKQTFIGTTEGLFRLGSDEPALLEMGITSLAAFEGHLWVGTQRGLFVLGQDGPLHLLQVFDLKVAPEKLDPKKLWIASVQGAFTIAGTDPRKGDAKPVLERPLEAVDFAEKTPIPVKSIESLGNNIWLTTLKNLQFDWAGKPYLVLDNKTYTPRMALPWQVSSISNIGNKLFFATAKGLGRIDNSRADFFSTLHPVRHTFEWDGQLGLCTTLELLRGPIEDSVFRKSTAGGSLSCNDSKVFQKKLWIAAEQGLFRYFPEVSLDLDSGSFFGWNIVVQGDELKALQPFYEGLPTNAQAKVNEQTISSDLSGVAYPIPLGRSTADVLLKDPYGNTRSKSIRIFRLPSRLLLLTTGVTMLLFVVLLRTRRRQ